MTALGVKEQSYVPYKLARSAIDAMTADMAAMKERHVRAMAAIGDNYERVEAESQAYFMTFIARLRERAGAEIAVYKKEAADNGAALEALRASSTATIANLQERVHTVETELGDTLRRYQTDVSAGASKAAEVAAALQAEQEVAVATLRDKLAASKAKAKARMSQVEDKFSGLVAARDAAIAALEADRRRLVAAVGQLHEARDTLAAALHAMETDAGSAAAGQGKTIEGLRHQLAALAAASETQHRSLTSASAATAAADARAAAAEGDVARLRAELAASQEAAAAANDAVSSMQAALAAAARGGGGGGGAAAESVALASARAEIAQLTSRLAANAGAAAVARGDVVEASKLAAVVAERDVLAAQLSSAVAAAAGAAAREEAAVAAARESELAHRIELAEARASADVLRSEVAVAKAGGVPPPPPMAPAAADAYIKSLAAVAEHAAESVKLGEAMWVEKKKRQALKLYEQEAADIVAALPPESGLRESLAAAVAAGAERIAEAQPAKAAFVLKQAIEQFIADVPSEAERIKPAAPGAAAEADAAELRAQLAAMRAENASKATGAAGGAGADLPVTYAMRGSGMGAGAGVGASTAALVSALARAEAAEAEVRSLQAELEAARGALDGARALSALGGGGGGGGKEDDDDGGKEGDDDGEEGEADEEDEEGGGGAAAAAAVAAGGAGGAAGGAGGRRSSGTAVAGKPGTGAAAAAAAGRTGGAAAAAAAAAGAASAGGGKDSAKLKEAEKVIKDLRGKIRTLETKLAAAAPGGKAAAAAPVVDEKAVTAAVEKRQAMLEKKWKKEREDLEKDAARELDAVTKKAAKAAAEASEAAGALAAVSSERDGLKRRLDKVAEMERELEALRATAEEARRLRGELDAATAKVAELDKLYKDEQILRKRYFNIIEDMKGKIRVYCRARPMSSSELDRGNYSVVSFPDEVTIDLDTGKGRKQFIYDQCFGPSSTQESVFEDTENLIQSAFDGYNVAMFAYGQTGSGKTFTMVGAREAPGITPRAMTKIFDLIEANRGVYDVTVQAYMVELYLDNLIDLFWKMDNPRDRSEGPKLDIKKDEKGLVVIKGVSIRDCPSAEALRELFDGGNAARHVGSTAMNATSSRSHLVFAILINTYNRATRKTTTGKISLIDLAGSERVGKTGASAERLKEAQSINKSLSALGNVISALSTNAAFVPYRDNKLTQLMSDSLGGNAKTLMFVNISPADYNVEETQSSLVYASRVKLITNSAEKMQETAEIARLKKIIASLKAGVVPADLEEVDVTGGDATPAAGGAGASAAGGYDGGEGAAAYADDDGAAGGAGADE